MKIKEIETKIMNTEQVSDEELHEILCELFYEGDQPKECELTISMKEDYFESMIKLLDFLCKTFSDYGVKVFDTEEVRNETIKEMVDFLAIDELISFIKGADRNNIIVIDFEYGDKVYCYNDLLDAYTCPSITDIVCEEEHTQEQRDEIMKYIRSLFEEE